MIPRAIRRNRQLPAALDHKELMRLGLEHVRGLSGAVWTDYNKHDPGATLLEHMCFALSDVAYRADHPIEDHIATALATEARSPEDVYPSPLKILTSTAVSVADVRRLVLSRHSASLRNVWLELSSKKSHEIRVGLHLKPEADVADTCRVVATTLAEHRPLGRLYSHPLPVPVTMVRVRASIRAAPSLEATDIEATDLLSRILNAIDFFLNPPLRFQPFSDALKEKTFSQIYDGPAPGTGILWPEDLPSLTSNPVSKEAIQRAISAVPGVRSVANVAVDIDPPSEPDETWPAAFELDQLSAVESLSFAAPEGSSPDDRSIRQSASIIGRMDADTSARAARQVFASLVHERRKAEEIPSVVDSVRRAAGDQVFRRGRVRDGVADYQSLWSRLPEIYRRLSDKYSERDRYRFRAYFSIFELQVATLIAQVGFASRLLDPNNEERRTYYAPSRDKLEGFDDQAVAAIDNELDRVVRDLFDTPLRSNDRRGRALDHLLARFGETVTPPAEMSSAETALTAKRAFLCEIVRLTSKRGVGQTRAGLLGLDRKPSPAADRIKLKAGFTNDVIVIEHSLFMPERRSEPDGRWYRSNHHGQSYASAFFKLRLPSDTGTAVLVHWPVDAVVASYNAEIVRRIQESLQEARLRQDESGFVHLSMVSRPFVGKVAELDVQRRFADREDALAFARALKATTWRKLSAERVWFPDPFYEGVTVLFPNESSNLRNDAFEAFAEEVARDNLPANIEPVLAWPRDWPSRGALLVRSREELADALLAPDVLEPEGMCELLSEIAFRSFMRRRALGVAA